MPVSPLDTPLCYVKDGQFATIKSVCFLGCYESMGYTKHSDGICES